MTRRLALAAVLVLAACGQENDLTPSPSAADDPCADVLDAGDLLPAAGCCTLTGICMAPAVYHPACAGLALSDCGPVVEPVFEGQGPRVFCLLPTRLLIECQTTWLRRP